MTVTPTRTALERLHDVHARAVDEYLAQHRVLDVFSGFLARVIAAFHETRRVPWNPFASLLRDVRRAELLLLLRVPTTVVEQPPPLDATRAPRSTLLQTRSRGLPSHLQLVTVEASSSSSSPPTTSLSLVAFRGVAERLPLSSREWRHELLALCQRLASLSRPTLPSAPSEEDGLTLQSVLAVVAPSSLVPQQRAAAVDVECHVVVQGEHLELAMAAFARELARRLKQQQQESDRSARAPVLLVNGATWSVESVTRQLSAFVVAVKSALAAAANVAAPRVELLLRVWRWSERDCQQQLLAVDTRFFLHFLCESKAAEKQTRTLPSGSRVAVSGVFLPAVEAAEDADAAWGVAVALAQTSSTPSLASLGASPSANACWQLSDRAELLLSLLHPLLDASSSSGSGSSSSVLSPNVALQLLGLSLEIHQLLTLLSDLSDVASAQSALETQCIHLQSRLERVVESAAVGAASSALSGLAPLLRSLVASIASAGAQDAALARAFDALVLLARPLLRDLTASPTTLLAPDLDPKRVDLRVDVAIALERRQYAPSVAAECALAQFIVDSRVDVAMESALMSSVAWGLPPNPFVAIARHLRVFALRHVVSRAADDTRDRQPQQRRAARITSIAASPSLPLYTLTGDDQDVDDDKKRATTFVTANARLSAVVLARDVLELHAWLERQRFFRPTAYQPARASYSVRVVSSLVLDRPLSVRGLNESSSSSSSVRRVAVTIVEHVFIEGADRQLAIEMFADAVRREAQRLAELLVVGDALLSSPATLEILRAAGDAVEASDVSLLSAAAVEQLVVDATAAQPPATVQLSSERLLTTFNNSSGHSATTSQQQLLLSVVSKCFVLHFAAPSAPRVDARGASDSVEWTSFISDTMRVRLHHWGVFPATAASVASAVAAASAPAPSCNAWRESAWRRRAEERPDRLLEMELVAPDASDNNDCRQRRMPRLFLCKDALPLQRLDGMMDVLAWTLERISGAASGDGETLRTVLVRVLTDARASVEPLALAMGYADALPLVVDSSEAASVQSIAQRVLMQLQLIHSALLHDMWADFNNDASEPNV